MEKQKYVSDENLRKLAKKFSALGEIMRLKILRTLMDGEAKVGQIAASIEATQTNVSRHLKLLSEAEVVSFRKDGTSIYYSICDKNIKKVCQLLCPAENGE